MTASTPLLGIVPNYCKKSQYSQQSRRLLIGSIRALDSFLGRASTTGDLNQETFECFRGWCATQYSPKNAPAMSRRLVRLWAFAWVERQCEHRPPAALFVRYRRPAAGRDDLMATLRKHASLVKASTKSNRSAIFALSNFLDRAATVHDLNVETIAAFRPWCEENYSRASADAMRYRILGVWRKLYEHKLSSLKPPANMRGAKVLRLWEVAAKYVPARECESLRDFVVHVYIPLNGETAANTVRLYEVAIRHFERYLARPARVADLTDEILSRFLGHRLQAGVTSFTANRELHKLLAFGRLAFRKRCLDEWPVVALAKEPRREPLGWMEDELRQLWQADIPGRIAGIDAKAWWLALHQVLYWTAERISAVMALRWDDVDLNTGWVLFRAETRKGRTGDIRRRLPAPAIEALRAIHDPSNAMVLPWPLTKTLLWTRYKELRQRLGLPTDRRSAFHRMRRTSASQYAAKGGDAMRLLDHSSPRVTKAYLDQRIAQVQQPADLLIDPGTFIETGRSA